MTIVQLHKSIAEMHKAAEVNVSFRWKSFFTNKTTNGSKNMQKVQNNSANYVQIMYKLCTLEIMYN